MKYIVTRSCSYLEENPRCPNAQKEIVPVDGMLKEAYTVELNTLEELHQLSRDVGHKLIVFPKSQWGADIPEIEIYDGYRE